MAAALLLPPPPQPPPLLLPPVDSRDNLPLPESAGRGEHRHRDGELHRTSHAQALHLPPFDRAPSRSIQIREYVWVPKKGRIISIA